MGGIEIAFQVQTETAFATGGLLFSTLI